MYVSETKTEAPAEFGTPLHEMTYRALDNLRIPFVRVDTDEATTMEDCARINQRLDVEIVKTIFLCTRNKSRFFLFVTTGDKPFQTRRFSDALDIPRVSFAPPEAMESMLGTKIGAATVFGVLLDRENAVQVVVDREVAETEWYGCSDGTTTGYMKIRTAHIIDVFLPFADHSPVIIDTEAKGETK